MPLIQLILMLALVGFVLYLITTYIPMPDPWKQVLIVIVVIALIIWLIDLLGIVGPTVPRLRGAISPGNAYGQDINDALNRPGLIPTPSPVKHHKKHPHPKPTPTKRSES